jgi:hypothetical protein
MSCHFLPLFVSNASLFSVRRCGYLLLLIFSFKVPFSSFKRQAIRPSLQGKRGDGSQGVASSSKRDGYRQGPFSERPALDFHHTH